MGGRHARPRPEHPARWHVVYIVFALVAFLLVLAPLYINA